jgi:hypothetical protein
MNDILYNPSRELIYRLQELLWQNKEWSTYAQELLWQNKESTYAQELLWHNKEATYAAVCVCWTF